MNLFDLLISPFAEFAFMRHALAGGVVLSLSACPIGVFLMLRRMSLSGDALSHAILPGVAAGFLLSGLQILPMALGGLGAGLVVALLSGAVSRNTLLREDASLAAFYLISLALGVLLVSLRGSSIDLMHILFGTVLALNAPALYLIGCVATVTLLTLAVIWRALVLECLDSAFLSSVSKMGPAAHFTFLVLVVINLVAGFQGLGTLLSVGLMVLPAVAARFWVRGLEAMCMVAAVIGMAATYTGLLLSYHLNVASGPAITLTAGAIYIGSLIFGPRGIWSRQPRLHHHKAA